MTNPVVTLVGNVVRAPEIRFTTGGKAWASFSLVTKDRVEDAGEWRDKDVTFYGVTVWEKQAEMLAECDLQPGTEVIVVGKMHLREYETAEGEKRKSLDVNAYHVGIAVTKWAYARLVKPDRDTDTASKDDPFAAPPAYPDEPPF
jgi:single-strand DNA-binding protein